MMAYTYSGILIIHKKDVILVHVAWLILENKKNKWKKSGTKFTLYDFSYMTFSE